MKQASKTPESESRLVLRLFLVSFSFRSVMSPLLPPPPRPRPKLSCDLYFPLGGEGLESLFPIVLFASAAASCSCRAPVRVRNSYTPHLANRVHKRLEYPNPPIKIVPGLRVDDARACVCDATCDMPPRSLPLPQFFTYKKYYRLHPPTNPFTCCHRPPASSASRGGR